MTLVVSSGRQSLRRFTTWMPLILIAVLGLVLVLLYTRFGAGVGGDAVRYVVGAENLLLGNGYSYKSGGGEIVPITAFPPFFPMVLAGLGLTGVDLFELARLLNALLFALTLFLCGYMLYRHTRSIWASIIACLMILTPYTLVQIFGWAMAEALYIFMMLLTILGMAVYLDRENPWILVGTAILSGLASLTRYVGLGLVGAGALSILVLSKAEWRRRLVHVILFSVLGITPIVIWFGRNARVAGTLANRSLIFHPMRGDLLRQYAEEIASWLVPVQFDLPRIRYRLLLSIGIFILGALLVLIPRIRSKNWKNASPSGSYLDLPWILLINIFSYLMVLVLNSMFLDAGTTPGAVSRYLAPVFIMIVMLFASWVSRLLEGTKLVSLSRIGIATLSVALILLYAQRTAKLILDPELTLGYVTAKMFWTEEIQALQAIEPTQTIITNNTELAYILSGRTAYMIPVSFNPNNLEEREDFPEQISIARERLSEDGVLIIFGYGELDDNARKVVEQLDVVPVQILNMVKLYTLP
ncbi:MAG: phospholipid carrier-dependent glycosyltransferase [Anaerolineales bacterium]|nr:phospholipid carrier-dependent glycosyltransferase [Anaerolineales bacterium]